MQLLTNLGATYNTAVNKLHAAVPKVYCREVRARFKEAKMQWEAGQDAALAADNTY